MSPSPTIRTRITPEMREAIDEYLAEEECELSDLMRAAVLDWIGRADLIEKMPNRGGQRKEKGKQGSS